MYRDVPIKNDGFSMAMLVITKGLSTIHVGSFMVKPKNQPASTSHMFFWFMMVLIDFIAPITPWLVYPPLITITSH
jgi:hypothetical protein